jgi:hypothetical protein
MQFAYRLCGIVAVSVPLFAAPPEPAPDASYFNQSLYPILQRAGCPGCHSQDGIAAATRLHFPEADAAPDEVTRFGRSLYKLVDRNNLSNSLLFQKPTRRIAHAGGLRIKPGSAEETALLRWIGYLDKMPPPADSELVTKEQKPTPQPVALRRLTHEQYNNTVRDLLGDDSHLADQFPPEDFVNGFKNQYQSQSISPLLAEAYGTAAEKLAGNAFRGGDSKHLIPCKSTEAGCRDKFIRDFGRRAFRRPLTADEASRYTTLFDAEANTRKSFQTGARIVVEVMLQSPNFLLRIENGADPKSKAYETASRLSYFLWNTMPDEALFASAGKGELDTPAGVERVARRMLCDTKSRQAVGEFISEWLRFDRLLTTVRDRRAYPEFTSELIGAMTEETSRFVSDLVWSNANFMQMYSAPYSFLSSNLAALYKVPAPKEEYGRVDFPPSTERAGVLGQATFLALTSKPADTSPTARGLFVREQFLCQEVPQPPPGVNTNLPPVTADKPQTNRDRLASHLTSESCASCHSLIDPIGFGLEKFDAIGQRREKLKLTFHETGHGADPDKMTAQPVALELNTEGMVAGITNSRFTSPRELGNILAQSAQCQECVVKQLFRYATGRKDTPADRPVIRQVFETFESSGFRFQELMVAMMKGTAFDSGVK